MTASVSSLHLLPSSLTTAAALERCLSQHLPLMSAFVGCNIRTYSHSSAVLLFLHSFIPLASAAFGFELLPLALTYSHSLALWLAVRCVDVGCRGDEGISEMFRQPDKKEKTVQMGGMN